VEEVQGEREKVEVRSRGKELGLKFKRERNGGVPGQSD
jgi:hypothetical protein